jgi:hypothetical protein
MDQPPVIPAPQKHTSRIPLWLAFSLVACGLLLLGSALALDILFAVGRPTDDSYTTSTPYARQVVVVRTVWYCGIGAFLFGAIVSLVRLVRFIAHRFLKSTYSIL